MNFSVKNKGRDIFCSASSEKSLQPYNSKIAPNFNIFYMWSKKKTAAGHSAGSGL
jgi:hypothetical protein